MPILVAATGRKMVTLTSPTPGVFTTTAPNVPTTATIAAAQ